MKDIEMHDKFENSEIRNFLSKSLRNATQKSVYLEKSKRIHNSKQKIFDSLIEDCKVEIEYFTEKMENYNAINAIMKVIEMNGWSNYDVSDYIEGESDEFLTMNFIGTEDECEDLKKLL